MGKGASGCSGGAAARVGRRGGGLCIGRERQRHRERREGEIGRSNRSSIA